MRYKKDLEHKNTEDPSWVMGHLSGRIASSGLRLETFDIHGPSRHRMQRGRNRGPQGKQRRSIRPSPLVSFPRLPPSVPGLERSEANPPNRINISPGR